MESYWLSRKSSVKIIVHLHHVNVRLYDSQHNVQGVDKLKIHAFGGFMVKIYQNIRK